MPLRPGLAAIAAGAAVWVLAGARPPPAQANPACYANNGHLYCGNEAPTGIYERPAFGHEDSAGGFHSTTVDTLTSNPSYFECWVHGEPHPGNNDIWYYTQGDVTHRYGYVPAVKLFTRTDPFPDVNECSRPAPPAPPAPTPPAPTPPAPKESLGPNPRHTPDITLQRCDSPWMRSAGKAGPAEAFFVSFRPTQKARLEGRDPETWPKMWNDLQRCVGGFPDLDKARSQSLYKQLACHATFAVNEHVGGDTWDLEGWREDIPWSVVFGDLPFHRCNWGGKGE